MTEIAKIDMQEDWAENSFWGKVLAIKYVYDPSLSSISKGWPLGGSQDAGPKHTASLWGYSVLWVLIYVLYMYNVYAVAEGLGDAVVGTTSKGITGVRI